ncbi:MAG TPA: toll/interleukin-1 receptor domain-containing protein [Natronosporangium sp.]
MKKTIFINYRSCDEPFAALFIDKRLAEHFGPERVFRDTRTIRPGTHFPTEIRLALQQCRVLLVVIGARWLRRGPGGRLIDRPDDYVRLEIANGLRRPDVAVVPVLVDDTPMPAASDLPADIAELASRQYVRLRFRDADADASRLVGELVKLIGDVGL